MADTNPSAYMSLPVPAVGVDPGPQWATDLNSCLTLIDAHDHTAGNGVQVTPAGLNINADLTFNNSNLTNARSIRFQSQSAALATGTDLGCLYEVEDDLYYNDGSGNQIRMTISGSIAGATGTISGLVSPASATYVSVDGTFVWQSASNVAANLDAGYIILRNSTVSSYGLTLQAPTLAADYTITLPPLPVSQKIMTMDASGNMSAPYSVDNSTISIVGGVIQVSAALLATIVNATPPGVISAYGGTAAPTGYLLCDGASVLRASYADLFTAIGTAYGAADGTHFNVPDLRGKFARGVDGGTGNDPNSASRTAQATGGNTGDNVGSIQADAFRAHTHSYVTPSIFAAAPGGLGPTPISTASGTTGSTGGSETRPLNVYVNYIIKT